MTMMVITNVTWIVIPNNGIWDFQNEMSVEIRNCMGKISRNILQGNSIQKQFDFRSQACFVHVFKQSRSLLFQDGYLPLVTLVSLQLWTH